MWGWSYGFLTRAFSDGGHLTLFGMASLVVASLNMLLQVTISLIFGDKSALKVGGRRGG